MYYKNKYKIRNVDFFKKNIKFKSERLNRQNILEKNTINNNKIFKEDLKKDIIKINKKLIDKKIIDNIYLKYIKKKIKNKLKNKVLICSIQEAEKNVVQKSKNKGCKNLTFTNNYISEIKKKYKNLSNTSKNSTFFKDKKLITNYNEDINKNELKMKMKNNGIFYSDKNNLNPYFDIKFMEPKFFKKTKIIKNKEQKRTIFSEEIHQHIKNKKFNNNHTEFLNNINENYKKYKDIMKIKYNHLK